jgi:hypothetical protein
VCQQIWRNILPLFFPRYTGVKKTQHYKLFISNPIVLFLQILSKINIRNFKKTYYNISCKSTFFPFDPFSFKKKKKKKKKLIHFPGKMPVPSQECVAFQLFRWLKTQMVELLIGFFCFCGLSLLNAPWSTVPLLLPSDATRLTIRRYQV